MEPAEHRPIRPSSTRSRSRANGLTAANLILAQAGSSVVVSFDGQTDGTITLENTTIEQLGNIAGQGNFRFFGEAAVTDSLDIWSAGENGSQGS